MRGAIFFFAGFAAGVLFLAVLFWQLGTWRPNQAAAAPAQPAVREFPPIQGPPNPLPDLSKPAPAAPLNLPPEQNLQIAPQGGPRLMIPVEGITVKQLRDNFNEMRDGHSHAALDIMAARGTPVVAVDEGNIAKLFNSRQGGLTIYQFDNTQKYCYYYAHLDHYAPGLREGTLVRKGEVLGFVGTTGDAPANAPHLHFAVYLLGPEKHWWEGAAMDPFPLLTGK